MTLGRDEAALLPPERLRQLLEGKGDLPLSDLERSFGVASGMRRPSTVGHRTDQPVGGRGRCHHLYGAGSSVQRAEGTEALSSSPRTTGIVTVLLAWLSRRQMASSHGTAAFVAASNQAREVTVIPPAGLLTRR
jgi:hypothetical protein